MAYDDTSLSSYFSRLYGIKGEIKGVVLPNITIGRYTWTKRGFW